MQLFKVPDIWLFTVWVVIKGVLWLFVLMAFREKKIAELS